VLLIKLDLVIGILKLLIATIVIILLFKADCVEGSLKFKGYSVILTNTTYDINQCFNHYIQKDVVEKSFHRFKEYLGLDRMYVHTSKRISNKTFIIYLCQNLFHIFIK
jgi:transposase